MGNIRFGIDGDGNYGYYGADDSLIPFKKNGCITIDVTFSDVNQTKTINISEIFPNYKNITEDNIFIQINSYNYKHTAGSTGSFVKFNNLARLTSYSSETGDVSLTSGKFGFGYSGQGQHIEYATSMTVIISG